MNAVREHRRGNQFGFTLVEAMVAISLSALGSMVVYSVFFSARESYTDSRNIAEVQSDSRTVLGLLAQDIRTAGSNPLDLGGLQRLPLASDTSIRVQNDADESGFINGSGEPAEDVTWTYDAVAETVTRTTPDGAAQLLTGVTDLTFSYLDGAGNVLGPLPLTPESRDLVRAVNVQLSMRILDDAPRTWTTILALRNDP